MEFTARIAGIVEIERWREIRCCRIELVGIRTDKRETRERFRELLNVPGRLVFICRLTARMAEYLAIPTKRNQGIAIRDPATVKLEWQIALHAVMITGWFVHRADGIVVVRRVRRDQGYVRIIIQRITSISGIIRVVRITANIQRELVNRGYV